MIDLKALTDIDIEDAKKEWRFKLLEDGTYSIEKYIGNDTDVTVPSFIEGKKVSEIKNFALYRDNVKYVKLSLPFLRQHLGYYFAAGVPFKERHDSSSVPSSLKTVIVRDGAQGLDGCICLGGSFDGCAFIENIIIYDGITAIETNAFRGCWRLKNLSIPDSVLSIGGLWDSPMGFTKALKYNEYKNGLYLASETNPYFALAKIIDSRVDLFTLHPETKIICGSAFYCSQLTEFDVPMGIRSIGPAAFKHSYLQKIQIPSSVKFIEAEAFEECKNLTEVNLSSGLQSIGDSAFKYCKKLSEIKIPDSVSRLGESAFSLCENLKKVKIGNRVKVIEKFTFDYCESLTQLKIGNNVEIVGYCAFAKCTKLKEVSLPDSVTKIDAGCFSDCKNLQKIIMSANVVEIESAAFENCLKLNEIFIPKCTKVIGYHAFEGCKKLTIYTKLKVKPRGWESRKSSGSWNPDNCPVIWSYKEDKTIKT